MKRRTLKLIISLALLVLSAYTKFDLPLVDAEIPFTLQSLAVFVTASFLTTTEYFLVILAYLICGVLGLPVFAEGSSGFSKIIGSSGGFLYGFIPAGLMISQFFEK
jgi:biotin transport system substrate-specific component